MESLLNNVAWKCLGTETRGFGFLYMLVTHSSYVQSQADIPLHYSDVIYPSLFAAICQLVCTNPK